MRNRWSDEEAERFVERFAPGGGEAAEALALRAYSSRLLGAEPDLVLHGGGNTSLKGTARDLFGDERPALFVKASGRDLAAARPEDHVAVDLASACRLLALPDDLDDRELLRALRACLLDPDAPHPSIETPVHAVLPGRYVDHTHALAILALSNRLAGEDEVREALIGEDGGIPAILPYRSPGIPLARAVAEVLRTSAAGQGASGAMVWMHHGLVTWGETARETYDRTIALVARAETFLERERHRASVVLAAVATPSPEEVERELARLGPAFRGSLAAATGDPDWPRRRVILQTARGPEVLAALELPGAREAASSPPLTADHAVRTGPFAAWLEMSFRDGRREFWREDLEKAVTTYARRYRDYRGRHGGGAEVSAADCMPRVVFAPGLGVIGVGSSASEAGIARDLAVQSLLVKTRMAAVAMPYEGLSEADLFEQEHRLLQQLKLRPDRPKLGGTIGLVTGAAGAIGSGISRVLLEAGCHLAATDLPGERLESFSRELGEEFPGRVIGIPMDVTDQDSVTEAFDAVTREWGGVDLLVLSAGAARVARIEELYVNWLEEIERVNVHGTLLPLAEAARRFSVQDTGGDVILISTKNVFAPGAAFGAYSATKAAAHQLARVASLELARHGVRVNMVAPDAVFGEEGRRSGLWAEVGPERMRTRGLSEAELEDYYRDRNLLKARITARHVGRAVLFLATRQTPTTGATIPVDGGLPDATPR